MEEIKNQVGFEKVYELMKNSFPDSEYRTYQEQKKLLIDDKYTVFTRNKDDDVSAFIAVWNLKNFTFLEHFAVLEKFRGKGFGSEFLLGVMKRLQNKIILEVEPPDDEVSKRRIRFYERVEFKLNDFYYEQASLRENYAYHELKIMSYPDFINEKEFSKIKKEIYRYVYKLEV